MAIQNDIGMEELVDFLAQLLKEEFPDEINMIYFGDPAIFPPIAFQDEIGKPKACVAIVPKYDRVNKNDRNPAFEVRALGVHIVVLVNMIPFFEALPKEAYGERMLVRLVGKIQRFLSLSEMQTLYNRVTDAGLMDTSWSWHNNGNDAIREAAIEYSVLIQIPRS